MDEDNLFTIDIDLEGNDVNDEPRPNYEVDFTLTPEEEGEVEDKPENTSNAGETCWNCSKSGHNLRDCPEPPDRIKINQSKKSFIKNQTSNKRYHDNKFAKFRPGHISGKLRDALGLKSHELPKHIYMMRCLGYPPGWLAEAKITNSGIKMYNSRGKRVKEVDEEDGEILNKFMKYDVEKIIEFPGFNVKAKGYKDDYKIQGFPPINPDHELPNFYKYLEKISVNADVLSDESTDDENVDMDLTELSPSHIIEEVKAINKRIMEINGEDSKSSSQDSFEEGEIVNRKLKINFEVLSDKTKSESKNKENSSELNDNNGTLNLDDSKNRETLQSSCEIVKSDQTMENSGGDANLNDSANDVITKSDLSSRKRSLTPDSNEKETEEVKKRKSDESGQILGKVDENSQVLSENDKSQLSSQNETDIIVLSSDNGIQVSDIENRTVSVSESNETQISDLGTQISTSVSNETQISDLGTQISTSESNETQISDLGTQISISESNETQISVSESNDETQISDLGTQISVSESNKTQLSVLSSSQISIIESSSSQTSTIGISSQSEILSQNTIATQKTNTPVSCPNTDVISQNSDESSSSGYSSIVRSLPIDIPSSRSDSPRGSVTSSSFGTPNIKSHSSFSKLPSFENFNKDISDVIDFENLPDSVGKYQKMCNVISKIRNFMTSKNKKKDK